MRRSRPWREGTARWRLPALASWTARLRLALMPPVCRRGAASLRSRRGSSNTPHTSTQEHPGEVHRDQPVRRLCRADVGDDGRRLVRYYLVALERRPLRSVALRLAPLAVRIRRLHDCALVDGPRRRALSLPCRM